MAYVKKSRGPVAGVIFATTFALISLVDRTEIQKSMPMGETQQLEGDVEGVEQWDVFRLIPYSFVLSLYFTWSRYSYYLLTYLTLLHGSEQWSAKVWDKAVVDEFKESSQHSVWGSEYYHEDL